MVLIVIGLSLPAGSAGTKVEACCRFAEATGRVAGIGRLEDAAAVLAGRAGTFVSPGPVETRWWPTGKLAVVDHQACVRTPL